MPFLSVCSLQLIALSTEKTDFSCIRIGIKGLNEKSRRLPGSSECFSFKQDKGDVLVNDYRLGELSSGKSCGETSSGTVFLSRVGGGVIRDVIVREQHMEIFCRGPCCDAI